MMSNGWGKGEQTWEDQQRKQWHVFSPISLLHTVLYISQTLQIAAATQRQDPLNNAVQINVSLNVFSHYKGEGKGYTGI